MKALGYSEQGPVTVAGSVVEFTAADPQPGPNDLLVEVRGVSVNPVDFKVRANRPPPEGDPKILGWDAAGVVKAVGSDVTLFKVGDEVMYAGEFTRDGSNAELQCVDERLVGRKPSTLGFADAAALPLTSITAWEMLFESLRVDEGGGEGEALLIIGGAGGVGSILIQLAKALTKLTVVATASRPDTIDWVTKMGADHVVNHRNNLAEEMSGLGIAPKYVATLTNTDDHFDAIVEMIKPRGHIAMIDDPQNVAIGPLKMKALTFSWEFMFARSLHKADDIIEQHKLLNRVADLVDQGEVVSTANKTLGALSEDTLREALEHQSSGSAIGKTVLDGFSGA
ncbi:zinc-binding alcohol dehydrogenase family protein [Pacificoceanicola onchidii]|uniref:zinc-binding alcohol dehydrogenase family protein n=1 Tax=Pacificoceanicola onchidii TaxID=2562685 RepID=UPI0010A69FAF|nr:zinc-binding alcohol dehydrogenase family protein [Pacificoceanicola onchidii]